MSALERRDRRLGVAQHVTLGLEAVIDDLGRVVREEAVASRGVADRRLDLALGLRHVLTGIDRDADVEGAPGRHARRPVAAGDAADVEIDRMLHGVERRVLLAAAVPVLLQPVQRLHDAVGCLDRIGAGRGFADMHRHAADMDLEPQHADLATDEPVPHRLGDEHGVGAVAALQAGEGAVAGALLLDHRLHMHVGGRLVADRGVSASSAARQPASPAFMSPAPRP